jgi:hypothetical protein
MFFIIIAISASGSSADILSVIYATISAVRKSSVFLLSGETGSSMI